MRSRSVIQELAFKTLPGADPNGFAFRPVSLGGAELVNTTEHVKPVSGGYCHENVGIKRRHWLGVAHLRGGAKQRVIPDHAHPLHLIEQLRQIFHDLILTQREYDCGQGSQ